MKVYARWFWLCFFGFVLGSGCATTDYDVDSYRIGKGLSGKTDSQVDVSKWFDGRTPDPVVSQDAFENASPAQQFFAAEIDYWNGDVERAFKRYLRFLRANKTHPLTRYVTARLYELRDDVVRYYERVRPRLQKLNYRALTPLARHYVGLIARHAKRHKWRRSKAGKPLSGDSVGYPWAWNATPRLSPWRLYDFDRTFKPQKQSRLEDVYLSPYVAEDKPVNRESTNKYYASGSSLYPGFESDGVYYMETFLTVEASEWKDFWVTGNFAGAAKVWIDDKQIFERRENGYNTGKRYRQISLGPGTHRVLIKLAYESNYRDWFDLMFLQLGQSPFRQRGTSFSAKPPDSSSVAEASKIERTSQSLEPSQLEPVRIETSKLKGASDPELYLQLLGAYLGQHRRVFEKTWSEWTNRHTQFSPAYGLRSQQVETLWELPSQIRQMRSYSNIQRAYKFDSDSLHYLTRIVEHMRNQSLDQGKLERLIKKARDLTTVESSDGDFKRVKNIEPINEWASYLANQGRTQEAEKAWERAVGIVRGNCEATLRLLGMYRARDHYPELSEVTVDWRACPSLWRQVITNRPGYESQRLNYYRRMTKRHPLNAHWRVKYAEELSGDGKYERAKKIIRRGLDKMPESVDLWSKRVDLVLATEGEKRAVETIQRAMDRAGWSEQFIWKMVELRGEFPLAGLLEDGRRIAKNRVQADSKGEQIPAEAYYAIDFAARQYFPDGSSVILTHYMVRMMTKNAINRHSEISMPRGARAIRVRTIKQNGDVRYPDQIAGKTTLSMPDVGKGDFVEVAYLNFRPPPDLSNTRVDGTKFFFQMEQISSLRSEYVVVNPQGSFARYNGAPESQTFEFQGQKAVRFVQKNSLQPRREPYTVPSDEYLPWIKQTKSGIQISSFEASRRNFVDALESSTRPSLDLENRLETWLDASEGGSAVSRAKNIFYRVTRSFQEPSLGTDFKRDASHLLWVNKGNPIVLLDALYDIAGIPADVYFVKGALSPKHVTDLGQFGAYRHTLVRVDPADSEPKWISPRSSTAMFNAVSLSAMNQPAVCVTCRNAQRTEVPSRQHFRDSTRRAEIDAKLNEAGQLKGTTTVAFHGIRADLIRSHLQKYRSDQKRRKYLGNMLNRILSGAELESYEIEAEKQLDEPLEFELQFVHRHFGTVDGEKLSVQRRLFDPPLMDKFASLSSRKTPMAIPGEWNFRYNLNIEFPESRSIETNWESDNARLTRRFGNYTRQTTVDDNRIESEIVFQLNIQRIQPEGYPQFRRWASRVERQAVFEAVSVPSSK